VEGIFRYHIAMNAPELVVACATARLRCCGLETSQMKGTVTKDGKTKIKADKKKEKVPKLSGQAAAEYRKLLDLFVQNSRVAVLALIPEETLELRQQRVQSLRSERGAV
jgi:hypothetical protein